MTRSECLATNVEGSFHRKHSTNERYFDLFTSEAVKARVSRPILGIFLYTNLFYTKKFAFFTPKILLFYTYFLRQILKCRKRLKNGVEKQKIGVKTNWCTKRYPQYFFFQKVRLLR